MRQIISRLREVNPILGAALITIVGVFVFSSIFYTCREERKIPSKNNSNIVDTVIKTDVGQCWVSYEGDPKKKIYLGNTLEGIVNNERVIEVRLIQKEGLRSGFYQLIWNRDGGFRREKI